MIIYTAYALSGLIINCSPVLDHARNHLSATLVEVITKMQELHICGPLDQLIHTEKERGGGGSRENKNKKVYLFLGH